MNLILIFSVVCWPWLRWAAELRPWSLIPVADDQDALELFKAGSFIRLGDGSTAKFWCDAWLPGGKTVLELVPILFSFVCASNITVAAALHNRRWVRDISGGLSSPAIAQYLHLWDMVEGVVLSSDCWAKGRGSLAMYVERRLFRQLCI